MGGDWGPDGDDETITLIDSFATTINSGGGSISRPAKDMRPYKGWYLETEAIVSGAATYAPVRGNAIWTGFDDKDGPNVATSTHRDDWDWWAQTNSPGAGQEGMFSGLLRRQDRCYGGQLTLSFSNFGTSNVSFTATLYGTSRRIPRPIHSMSPWDDVLYENNNIVIGAGAGYVIPLPMFYGRLGFHRENVGAGASTLMLLRWGSFPAPFIWHTMVSNAVDGNPQNFEVIAPRRAALVTLSNPGAGTTNRLMITSMRERM